MWLVPTSYCFLLQAASLGNDLFGAVFVLAAMDFALRTKTSCLARDFFTSVLAAALMTSAKPSNLPVMLPWALAMLPSVPLLWRWPVRTMIVGLIALMASYLPSAVLNWHFCGDWTGLKVETGPVAPAPFFLTGVNAFLLGIQNFTPPVFPLNSGWHEFFVHHLPAGLALRLDQMMEVGLRTFDLDLLQIEEHAGLGFGVCVLLVVSLVAGRFIRLKPAVWQPSAWLQLVRWSPVISLLVLMTQSRYAAFSREITPYYALLLPVLLALPGQTWVVRQKWWCRTASLVFVFAAGLLVVSPARPLFPVSVLLDSPSVPARTRLVYFVYHERSDAFAPVHPLLPADLKVLGLLTYDDPETSLWRPFGGIQIEHICPADTLVDLQRRNIRYVLLNETLLQAWFKVGLDDWSQRMHAAVVGKAALTLRAAAGPQDWYVLKLN
jgi:hypothetical protein